MEFQGRESIGETPSHISQFMFAKHDAAIPPTWLSLLFFINAILYSVQVIKKCVLHRCFMVYFSFQLTDSYIYI